MKAKKDAEALSVAGGATFAKYYHPASATYKGCYKDARNRDLPHNFYGNGMDTVA